MHRRVHVGAPCSQPHRVEGRVAEAGRLADRHGRRCGREVEGAIGRRRRPLRRPSPTACPSRGLRRAGARNDDLGRELSNEGERMPVHIPRRGGHFEYRHAHTRAIPSAMPRCLNQSRLTIFRLASPGWALWGFKGMGIRTCVHMCTDVCTDVCIDVCTHMCTDMCIWTCYTPLENSHRGHAFEYRRAHTGAKHAPSAMADIEVGGRFRGRGALPRAITI